MIKRIEMRMKEGDCGAAALAMVAGISYEESYKLFTDTIFEKEKNFRVTKGEMEKALKALNLNYFRCKHYRKWENITGDACLIDANKKAQFWHWIVYVPLEKAIIDPRIGKPDRIYQFDDYWLSGPAFSIIYLNDNNLGFFK